MKLKKFKRLSPLATTLCVGGALVGGAAMVHAEDSDKVKELSDKVDALESLLKKEGITPSSTSKPVFGMSDINISGFVTASYFYDTSRPADRSPNGYLWNRSSGDFTVNKVKLTVASTPAKKSGDEWDAAFRASFIWGSDAQFVNTGGNNQGFADLREAYIELNAPIGSGLNIRAGQLISLLNWESGDGGAANPNFSQGDQWFYTGNGPSTGLQLGYDFTDAVGIKLRVQNGMYSGPFDNDYAKTFMGAIDLKPCDKVWVNLLGFAGDENPNLTVTGGSILAGVQVTDKLGTGMEFDYFNFGPNGGKQDGFWSIGGWAWYDFTSVIGVAFRAEFLDDHNGFGWGPGTLLGFPVNNGGDVYTLTATLNYKPTAHIKIQPEIRYDGTSIDGAFDGKDCRIIIGCGASYLF